MNFTESGFANIVGAARRGQDHSGDLGFAQEMGIPRSPEEMPRQMLSGLVVGLALGSVTTEMCASIFAQLDLETVVATANLEVTAVTRG